MSPSPLVPGQQRLLVGYLNTFLPFWELSNQTTSAQVKNIKNQSHLWTYLEKSWMKHKHHFHLHSIGQNIQSHDHIMLLYHISIYHISIYPYHILYARQPCAPSKLVLNSWRSHFCLSPLSNKIKISKLPYWPPAWCAFISTLPLHKELSTLQTQIYREVFY